MQVKIINHSKFDLPKYETEGAAGLDVRTQVPISLGPQQRVLVQTGLFLEVPKGMECQVRTRSGMAFKKGVVVLNSPGTIDSDYRGEVGVILYNSSNDYINLDEGERIAQLVFAKVEQIQFEQVTSLEETQRGEGGFGSTGTK